VAVSIERIKASEWQTLRDIRLRSLQDSPEAFGQRYDEAAATTDEEWKSIARSSATGNRRTWIFARDDTGSPIGVVQGRRRPPQDCLLFSMWVDPQARGLGVGRGLVDAIQDWADAWGAERVVLWVLAANEPAMRFYDRIGFSVLNDGPDAISGHSYGAFAMQRSRRDHSP
jgi:RimJ/RimL family protein N-acetyltransferase